MQADASVRNLFQYVHACGPMHQMWTRLVREHRPRALVGGVACRCATAVLVCAKLGLRNSASKGSFGRPKIFIDVHYRY